MNPIKIYVCIYPLLGTIFKVGSRIYLYEKDLDGKLDNLLKRKTNHFTLIEDNSKK